MTIDRIQDQIIEEVAPLEDWFEKYQYLKNMAKNLEELEPQYRVEENLLGGCQSKVWLKAGLEGPTLVIKGDSDALLTKGLLSLLLRVLNRQSPQDIINADLYFVDRIGLNTDLSPTRKLGLAAMINHIKSFAKKYTH